VTDFREMVQKSSGNGHRIEFNELPERPEMTAITVYTKPGCPRCRATVRALARAHLSYRLVDLSGDDAARDYLLSLGYPSAPVALAGTEHWSGHRPDRITALATATA
jgi:glutaredoxin-like protein NrdH